MKEVLISIQPKWVEKIANDKKTIEVRKTRPKLETPFKCYIYCTKAKEDRYILELHDHDTGKITRMDGKVIGEFVCDRILESFLNNNDGWFIEKGCLTQDEIDKYQGDKAMLYGWHISDLVIYDKPKSLEMFQKPTMPTGLKWENNSITRPPQSWCYVEKGE